MKFRMGVQHLQKFLESPNLEGGAVSVDLLKIARNVTQRQQPHNTNRKIRPIGNKLKLIVDAENCLDRLYGGYFSDWACGGQWNRMVQFLSLLTQAIEPGSIELAVVFNGTIESCRMNEWISEQAIIRERVTCILKHINTKATPPPKVWWIPPTCLRSALRMALRHLGITVMCTMDDHHQEVIAYCREYGFHGLLADDAEYAAFDPPRYFSSENLKLTYKGSLETKEYMVRELTKTLNLSQEQVCVMAALLGNFLLSESSLQDLYRRIGLTDVTHNMKEKDDLAKIEANMRQLADYVKNLPQPSSMDALVEAVFGNDKRASKFRQSVQYYLNGTASGFLKYCAPAGCPKSNLVTPTVAADVLRTASLRHQKGLMVPQILHVLSTQEIRLPCLMEDELNREFPSIHDIYQPLRQNVYAVIFNLHHLRYLHSKKKESNEVSENDAPPDIFVKEWKYSRSNPYLKPEEVKAEPLPWAVPTLHRLWFGPAMDDKRRRMRALLSCLSSDSPLILNTAYVPQHMLIMACVLRYIMSQDRCILRPQELDAFLCQAFSTDLMNAQYLQELTLSVVTSRGVQLASLFMQGVEYAIFANDACGAPLPWLMCCPWLYFDGKLFHHVLARSAHSKNILELCESHIERVIKVERMRKAILEGLDVKFAKPPLTAFQGLTRPNLGGSSCLPQMPIPSARSNPGLRRPVLSKGGQLQVAGVVVGSWGANYGYQGLNRQSACPLNYRAGRGDNQFLQNCKERGQGGKSYTPGYPVGNRKQPTNKKRSASNKSNNNSNKTAPNQSRTLTVNTEGGDVPVLEGRIVGAKEDEQIQSNKEEQHHGQGDALSKVESQKY
ncbi:constitutive coactivator of PPAR-gamma-like protein 1 homolog isoform X4 [Coccinella septempunctata]|uniref:constitutive coactivator of PPAR-gamma-like protein 1 homolog isoform X4 n=1 Tax=Coccinella septempunctata TaxID=41139 RepID=UPI001D06E479|nr:constitutive coactivator of PPAR-gamma-like protein 1 homolog isoform X4 [Coccinella septempunctata]